jgi:RNA polymerase sigma factor (sigma-70 family)
MKVLYPLLATAILSENGSDKAVFWTACYNEYSNVLAQKLRSKFKQLEYNASFDFVQDAFVELLKRDMKYFEKYFKDGNKMEALLFETTKNTYLNHVKPQKNAQPVHLNEDYDSVQDTVCEPSYDMETLARLLKHIDKTQAKTFKLFAFCGMSQQEIADMEGTSLSAIKMRITRAKESLKKAFEADS